MINEAIILVGGKGTRLRSVVSDVPKPMAEVAGRPFLSYLLDALERAHFTHIVLATGYKKEVIRDYYGTQYRSLQISYAEENQPLGTGGAIVNAMQYIRGEQFMVLNGDTYFAINYSTLQIPETFTMVAREVPNNTRYGGVGIDENGHITYFGSEPLTTINGGIYLINKAWLQSVISHIPQYQQTGAFSFENDFLAQCYKPNSQLSIFNSQLSAIVAKDYFIDIGIPEDYAKAQTDFVQFYHPKYLFLDRDGVINRKRDNDYVKSWEEFEFLEGVQDALKRLSERFERIVIVTNQQCVGKGIITQNTLDAIHQRMREEIENAGGRIDAILTCTDLADSGSKNRKPETGLGLQAKALFPEIDFTRSVMVGDAETDRLFGYRLQMQTIMITPEFSLADYAR